MKKMFSLLLLGIFVLSSTACSVVLKSNVPQVESSQTGWSDIGHSVYEFHYQTVSVQMHASYSNNRRIIWFGPPLIPIIPKFLFSHRRDHMNFIFRIDIDSPTHAVIIDTSKIQAQVSSGKILRTGATDVSLNSEKLIEHPIQLTLPTGKLNFYLVYDVLVSELNKFTIDLGSIIVNGESIKMPSLQFRKGADYLYAPIVLADHLED